VDLVYAAASCLNIEPETVKAGLEQAGRDIGALTLWRYRANGGGGRAIVLVNAFAANDPESTRVVYDKVAAVLGSEAGNCVGLLNLRRDRADRTLQWLEALADGWLNRFGSLYLCGLHARALRRRLQRLDGGTRIELLRGRKPVELTRTVVAQLQTTGGFVFGFGNVGEVGRGLVDHWREVGEPLEV
jgi:hypothetical protein